MTQLAQYSTTLVKTAGGRFDSFFSENLTEFQGRTANNITSKASSDSWLDNPAWESRSWLFKYYLKTGFGRCSA